LCAFGVTPGFERGPERAQSQRVAGGLILDDGTPEARVGQQQRHHEQRGITAPGECQDRGMQDVTGPWTPAIGEQLVKDRQYRVSRQVRITTHERVDTCWPRMARIEEHDVTATVLRYAIQEIVNQITLGID